MVHYLNGLLKYVWGYQPFYQPKMYTQPISGQAMLLSHVTPVRENPVSFISFLLMPGEYSQSMVLSLVAHHYPTTYRSF